MSAAIVVVIALGTVSTALLAVVVFALFRQVKTLSAALKRYREEVQPVLERIRDESDRARRRAEEVPTRVPTRGPGARLRKSS